MQRLRLTRLSCGNCGGKKFRVYGDGDELAESLVIVCDKCRSDTIVGVERPRMSLKWGHGEGKLCFLDDDDVIGLKCKKGE